MSRSRRSDAPELDERDDRRRPGRPQVDEVMASRTFRATEEEWKICQELGGGKWIRSKIAAARKGRK